MARRVGVLAVQGDFEQHARALSSLAEPPEVVEVRTSEDLATVERLIIPGGESTTVGLLLERYGLGEAIRDRARNKMPIWGTCMGMILMAKDVEDRPQYTLGILDIGVQRNAFGRQVHSFEDEVDIKGWDTPTTGVFIRAPVVTRVGENVEVLGVYGGKIVAVRMENLVGTSFHPELTDDLTFHSWFLAI